MARWSHPIITDLWAGDGDGVGNAMGSLRLTRLQPATHGSSASARWFAPWVPGVAVESWSWLVVEP